MPFWDVWETIFHDNQAEVSKYEYKGPLDDILPCPIEDVLCFEKKGTGYFFSSLFNSFSWFSPWPKGRF